MYLGCERPHLSDAAEIASVLCESRPGPADGPMPCACYAVSRTIRLSSTAGSALAHPSVILLRVAIFRRVSQQKPLNWPVLRAAQTEKVAHAVNPPPLHPASILQLVLCLSAACTAHLSSLTRCMAWCRKESQRCAHRPSRSAKDRLGVAAGGRICVSASMRGLTTWLLQPVQCCS